MKYKPSTLIAKLKSAAKNKRREYGGSTEESEVLEQAAGIIRELLSELSKRPEIPETGIGDFSDGYHTFNQLYYQRMMLFATLVKTYKERAWKSLRHESGELCFGGGWFIVGIDTPEGSYTYHYETKDFHLFDCQELPTAKHWDGHTEEDVTRLLSLPPVALPDEKTALAMAAGSYAIRRAKRYFGASYMWDVHGQSGGPKELSFAAAAEILADLSHESLTRSAELHDETAEAGEE